MHIGTRHPNSPCSKGAQWLSGRVLDSRPKGRRFEPHQRHCVVSLSKNINPSLVLVQPRKTRPFITERLLMGRKESNQTNKITILGAHTQIQSASNKGTCTLVQSDSVIVNVLYLLSADNLCKQFGPRSGPIKCQALSGSKLFDIDCILEM